MRNEENPVRGLGSWPDARLLAVLLLLATLPYLNALFNAFVYDDIKQVLANPYVQSWRHLPAIFRTNVWSFLGEAGVTNHYRPLMTLTYLVCWQLFGPVPFGFHLVNLLFHAGVVWILYRVTERLFASRATAFVSAALFALHPIHTESVAWIAGITDLQLAFFYLLTFRLFLDLGDTNQRPAQPAWRAQAAMAASFVLALLSKEIAVTLPAVATLYEHACRRDRSTTSLRQKLQRYGSLWGFAAGYILFRIWLLGAIAPLPRRELPTWPEAILSGFTLALQYFWKLIWPVELSAFYVFTKSTSLADPRVLAGAGLLCGLLWLLWRLWKRDRAAAFALLWVAATLAPVMNARWMAANVFAERYLYLPSAGFCWLVAWAWMRLWSGTRRPALRAVLVAGLCVVGLLYAARVVTRNRDWRDDETLYTRTLERQPGAYLIRNNLGTVYWNRGQQAAAVLEWQRALSQQPDDVVLLNNLGMATMERRDFAEADGLFRRAIRIRPAYPEPYRHLGRLFELQGRDADAEREFRTAIRQAPLNAASHNNLAALLLRTGRVAEAVEHFRAAISSQPSAEAYAGLGEALAVQKDFAGAEEAYRRALDHNTFDLRARLGLARVLEGQGKTADALREYRAVLELDPRNQEAEKAVFRLR